MITRYRSLLASRTVHALQFIAADTRQAFVSPALVDRMDAMLNYVLDKQVGKGKEQRFCEALPRDGRSFSKDIFPQAERVLINQSDPFNRAPLTADMLQPIDELKLKVDQWKLQRL